MAAKKESSSKQLPTGPAGDKKAALETALAQIEKQFGKGAVMKLGTNVAGGCHFHRQPGAGPGAGHRRPATRTHH